jgi:hypothetical protein
MAAAPPAGPAQERDSRGLPQGRYGRTADERADRKLKIVGAVFGVVLLTVIAWIGVSYISRTQVSAELTRWKVVSDTQVQGVLEVHKGTDQSGVCTVRALAVDQSEVGRKDIRLTQHSDHFTTLVDIRTTGRATAA